jgi:general secretion pathway protein K
MNKQSGIALITVLIIVALITPILAYLASQHRISIERTTALTQSNRTITYALSVETWVKSLLLNDEKNSQYDGLDEVWAQNFLEINTDGVAITGQIIDLQGRFNLNLLGIKNNEPYQKSWQKLLQSLEIDELTAQESALAIEDWVDENEEISFPSGAEDLEYLGLGLNYKTANQAMVNHSELRLVKGINSMDWDKLEPFISALPNAPAETKININTASIEILRVILPEEAESILTLIENDRKLTPFQDISAFKEYYHSHIGKNLPTDSEVQLTTKSDNFLLTTHIKFAQQEMKMYSYLQRSSQGVQVVSRNF